MKILLEEIVRCHPQDGPDKGVGHRYRRTQRGTFDAPVELLPVLQDGFVLVIDEESGARRRLVIANVRVTALVDVDHIGLILDLIDPELYRALEDDQEAPADYAAFCELEGIEP